MTVFTLRIVRSETSAADVIVLKKQQRTTIIYCRTAQLRPYGGGSFTAVRIREVGVYLEENIFHVNLPKGKIPLPLSARWLQRRNLQAYILASRSSGTLGDRNQKKWMKYSNWWGGEVIPQWTEKWKYHLKSLDSTWMLLCPVSVRPVVGVHLRPPCGLSFWRDVIWGWSLQASRRPSFSLETLSTSTIRFWAGFRPLSLCPGHWQITSDDEMETSCCKK